MSRRERRLLEKSAVLRNQEIVSKRYWPWSLIFITIFWLGLTIFMIKTNGFKKGAGWGRLFLSKAVPRNVAGYNAASPGLSASPTIYVPSAPQVTGDYESVSFNLLSGFYFWDPLDDIDNGTAERNKKRARFPRMSWLITAAR